MLQSGHLNPDDATRPDRELVNGARSRRRLLNQHRHALAARDRIHARLADPDAEIPQSEPER